MSGGLTPGRAALLCGGAVAVTGLILAHRAASATEALARDEMMRLGRYVAHQLAMNAPYAVLTEDVPVLTLMAEGGLRESGPDVVGVVMRDARGKVLAQVWRPGRSLQRLPPVARALEERTVTPRSDEWVLIGAPVMVRDVESPGTTETWQGGVDVAISLERARRLRAGTFLRMSLLTALLGVLAAAAAWTVARRPDGPLWRRTPP